MSSESTRPINANLPERPSGRGRVLRSRTAESVVVVVLIVALAIGAAVAFYTSSQRASSAGVVDQPVSAAEELRLGYFGNLTHAPALVGLETGLFAEELGDTSLSTQVFNAGPAAIEALNADAIDAAFIGPNPAINSYVKSEGASLRIVAGSTSGGAQLVVREGIENAEDLRGATLATPQLGNTQDVALRTWLIDNELTTDTGDPDDVVITPTENAVSLQLFSNGDIDGAWVPEPWASRLVLEAGGRVLVDEKDLWEDGRFPTTLVIVRTDYLTAHPDQVRALLRGEQRSIEWIGSHSSEEVAEVLNRGLESADSKPLPAPVMERALGRLDFTQDPLGDSLEQLLANGIAAGTATEYDISGILDLTLLDEVRADPGPEPIPTTEPAER